MNDDEIEETIPLDSFLKDAKIINKGSPGLRCSKVRITFDIPTDEILENEDLTQFKGQFCFMKLKTIEPPEDHFDSLESKKDVDGLINSLKEHRQECGGHIESADDPMSRKIGFLCKQCDGWFGVPLGEVKWFGGKKEKNKAQEMFKEHIKSQEGRQKQTKAEAEQIGGE